MVFSLLLKPILSNAEITAEMSSFCCSETCLKLLMFKTCSDLDLEVELKADILNGKCSDNKTLKFGRFHSL